MDRAGDFFRCPAVRARVKKTRCRSFLTVRPPSARRVIVARPPPRPASSDPRAPCRGALEDARLEGSVLSESARRRGGPPGRGFRRLSVLALLRIAARDARPG